MDKEKQKRISDKIQVILQEEEAALQPFLHYTEYAITPQVRLVDLEKKDEQGENTTEDTGAGEEDGSTTAESA